MPLPKYLIEKIARHGAATQRLITELEEYRGEHAGSSDVDAIAFDAADFVWAFFAQRCGERTEVTRHLRDAVAEALIRVIGHTLAQIATPDTASVEEEFCRSKGMKEQPACNVSRGQSARE